MKKLLLIWVLFVHCNLCAQIIISGTVYEKSGPLEGAAVYFNNTKIGTTTTNDGSFKIPTKKGNFELIVSFLGYKKVVYPINTETYKEPLVIVLEETQNTLDEIIIKKTIYDDAWKYNLATFKREFIGATEFAKDCHILNPKVLHFNYDAKNNILTAIARKPLKIKNKSLGYEVIFELEEFTIHNNRVTYLGYSRYKNLKGGKRKQRKWKKNRQNAYNGSYNHFYQTLLRKNTYEEGFLVHLFKRVPNPERPSEQEIKRARELIKLQNKRILFSSKIENPKTALDSALYILNKVQFPKFVDKIHKTKAPITDFTFIKNGLTYINFDYYLMVIYTKELEEKGYILRNMFGKTRAAYPQSSNLIPMKKATPIDKNGELMYPLDVFYEGYWSFEKFGNSLPLDYEPNQ
ncbi:carboxypeptidase-like regulatory domain-containing protein [Polaribacter tangerinus]|uniref:carboxypeptidase-like regulatory domain-containing protein n=1 Tax=Polaribacter tangerinus TaxID=1920034 RepID=UPI000B4AA0CD|nr:carboxypeptidase-like regulatory domain-containing protein [Polaribacter tangerinus]